MVKVWQEDVVCGQLNVYKFEARTKHDYRQLTELSAHGIKNLIEIPFLPHSLRILDIVNCGLIELPPLPPTLRDLWCWGNNIRRLPRFLPVRLEHIDCSNNPIDTFPSSLPLTLKKLYARNCNLSKVSSNIKGLEIIEIGYDPVLKSDPWSIWN